MARASQAVLSSSDSTARSSALDAGSALEAGARASAGAMRVTADSSTSAADAAGRSTRSASSSAESSAREYKSSATLRMVPGRSSSLTSKMLRAVGKGRLVSACARVARRRARAPCSAPAGEGPRQRAA